MADGTIYRDMILVANLVEAGDGLVLDLPFRVYGQNLMCEGRDITYELSKLVHVGKQTMAKVDYDVRDQAKVAAYAGKIGSTYEAINRHKEYVKHAPQLKKEDYLADEKGKFTGTGKDDYVPFCLFLDVVNRKEELFPTRAVSISSIQEEERP